MVALGSVLGYMLLSAVLVRLPAVPWVRRRPRINYPIRVVGHRGGSLIAPENTLLAFRLAAESGVDLLELDVCESRDGVPIVCHDESLKRIVGGGAPLPTGSPQFVKDLTATDPNSLPTLSPTIPLHFPSRQTGHYVQSEASLTANGRQRLCTLRELFELLPRTPMHIDVKQTSTALVHSVVQLVREFNRDSITILGAATNPNSSLIHTLQAKRDFATFASARQVIATMILYFVGLLPLVPFDYDVFDFPAPTRFIAEELVGRPWLAWLLLYTPPLWRHLRSRGVRVLGFVINDEEGFAEMKDWPICGVMTDDPVALRRFVDAQGGPGPWQPLPLR